MNFVQAIEHLLKTDLVNFTGPAYIIYQRLFTEYIEKRATAVDGHLPRCMTDGDVVDTCSCHYYLETKPREFVQAYLLDHFFIQTQLLTEKSNDA